MSSFRILTVIQALILLAIAQNSFAQTKKSIIGLIMDQNEKVPVKMASITNITLGKTTVSSSNGTFELVAAVGHIIAFSANGYYADTLTLTVDRFSMSNLILTLKPLPSTLANVTVVGKYSQYQVDSIERRKAFLQDVPGGEIPVMGRANDLGFGTAINLDRFSKREKQKQKARSLFELAEQEAYINWRWNEEIVVSYTRFEGEKLLDFMNRYRPDYLWLRKNPDDKEIMYYINTALKKEKRRNPNF
jgi:hypothetical protein